MMTFDTPSRSRPKGTLKLKTGGDEVIITRKKKPRAKTGDAMDESLLECMSELKGTLLQGMSDLQTSFGAQLSKQSGEIQRLSERSERTEDFMSATEARLALLEKRLVRGPAIEDGKSRAELPTRRELEYVPMPTEGEDGNVTMGSMRFTPRMSARRGPIEPPAAEGAAVGISIEIPTTAEAIKLALC